MGKNISKAAPAMQNAGDISILRTMDHYLAEVPEGISQRRAAAQVIGHGLKGQHRDNILSGDQKRPQDFPAMGI